MEVFLDFDSLSFDELDQHAMEKLVFQEDEISPLLSGHLIIEKVLETLISRHLEKPKVLFGSGRSFSLKVDIASAMGLISDQQYSAFKCINKIRNNYAHQHDYHVEVEELQGFKIDWEDAQHRAFSAACTVGAGEAAKIATIFLCWDAIRLIKPPEEDQ